MGSELSSNKNKLPLGKLMRRPRFFFGLMIQMTLMMSLQYMAPNLAIHLSNFGYSQTMIGLSYGIPAILYACTCPFVFILCRKIQKRGLIVIGLTVIQIAMLMVGGSDTLDDIQSFRGDSFFIFLGLCLVGLSAGFVSIPVLPEMLESIE